MVHNRSLPDYFPHFSTRNVVMKPVLMANVGCRFDIDLRPRGGGESGQAQACATALARAFAILFPELRPAY